MNWFAFFPGLYKDPNVGGDKIGFFVNPAGRRRSSTQLGGQGISVVSYSDNQDEALQYIKWFAQPDVQKKWWALGGYSCPKAVLNDPGFPKSAPFAADFLRVDGHRQGLLGRAVLCPAAAGHAEARARLRRRRQGHRQGSARRSGQGLDRSSRKKARSSRAAAWSAHERAPGSLRQYRQPSHS